VNKKAVKELTKQGCIVGKEAAKNLTDEDIEAISSLDSTPMYISDTMLSNLRKKSEEENSKPAKTQETTTEQKTSSGSMVLEKRQEETEKTSEDEGDDLPGKSVSEIDKSEEQSSSKKVDIMDSGNRSDLRTKVEVMDQHEIKKEKKDVPEFLQHFNNRYDKMKKLLMRRKELQAATTLNRLERRNEGEDATAIGFVKDKYSTDSGKWVVELEDNTGVFKALIDERDGERLVQDEVIGVIGSMGGDIIYVNSVVRADMPIPQGTNTTEQKVEAAYISDLHIGSKDTMHDQLDKFARWLGSEEAKNVGYLVIAGDLVEGVGVYPGQEEELSTPDIYKQYSLFEDWVEKIPERIQVIAGPGNHDVTRLEEPQPKLPDKAFPRLKDFNNFHRVQNPQMVRLHGIESRGIKNLMYHGHSFDPHVDQIQHLRERAYDEPEHVMIDLLKRRHLAPTFGSNRMSPEHEDYHVIEKEPDVFVSGHFHSHCNESYKGVNIINSSSFQAQTDFQKRVGHEPDPGKVTLVDYKTRKTRVKKFR